MVNLPKFSMTLSPHMLEVASADTAERLFSPLSEGGSVKLPVQKTFWAARYGIVVDRFGIPWEINA